jgi:hypothetical protein
MFSLDKFYNIIHHNLIAPLHPTGRSVYFYPFGTYDQRIILHQQFESTGYIPTGLEIYADRSFVHCYFFDQEPLYDYTQQIVNDSMLVPPDNSRYSPRNIAIFANSEKSEVKDRILKEYNLQDWYYFFHGFAALHWYRDFQYVNPGSFNRFSKVFICLNHLISKYRSYRLHLVSNLIDRDLVRHGHVSLFLQDQHGSWQDSVNDDQSLLDPRAKTQIITALSTVEQPMIVDTAQPNGTLSADLNLNLLNDALFHVVTETVYFLPKLHLTEKIFKPIVARRPFILVAAPGNLAYLRSYGFRTFDRWIDESYDLETDHYLRIEKITNELERLCKLSPDELNAIYAEMRDTLEYNHKHFYTEFKRIIVNEMVDNLEGILGKYNNGRQPNNHSNYHRRLEFEPGYSQQVRQRFLR